MLAGTSLFLKIISALLTIIMAFTSGSGLKGILDATPEKRAEEMAQLFFSDGNEAFESGTNEIVQEIVRTVLLQFTLGVSDPNALESSLEKLPHEDIERTDTHTYSNALSRAFSAWCIDAFGGLLPEPIKTFITMNAGGINDLYIYLAETEYDGIYTFMGSYVTDAGEVEELTTGAYYDTRSGMVYGKDNNGILGIGYDFNLREYVVINPVDVWMRDFGYNVGYDIIGDMLFMDCDTVRVKFNCDGRDWMIQFWKGNYTSVANGAEIGIYYLENDSRLHYTCAKNEDMLEMRFALLCGENTLFERGWAEHWWLSGFQIAPAIKKEYLALDCSIRFKTAEMRDAFVSAAAQYAAEMAVEEDGLQVNIFWK